MSAVDFFDAARAYKRELTGKPDGLDQADVDALNAATSERWRPASSNLGHPGAPDGPIEAGGLGAVLHTGLSDPAAFFASLRKSLGGLSQGQVDGINRLLKAMGADQWPLAWVAYGLASPWWETNKQMHPVEEGYYLGPEKAKRHQKSLRYYPWYGRGDVQLTWEANYRAADKDLGLGGTLIANPDRALEPELSARILVWGMRKGAFTTKSLAHYLPQHGAADRAAFKQARRIINRQDKADEIAGIALSFQRALQEGGWS